MVHRFRTFALLSSALISATLASADNGMETGLGLVDRYGVTIVALVFFAWLAVYRFAPWLKAEYDELKQERRTLADEAKRDRADFIKALAQQSETSTRNQEMAIERIVEAVSEKLNEQTAKVLERIDGELARQQPKTRKR